jgi:uncharacterized coiled-coil DUF342 family protein
MSSIGEAKERIAAASESADEAKNAMASAKSSIDEAVEALNDAAADSDHEKMTEALGAYQEAVERFEEVLTLISQGQQAANEYASSLG